MMKWYPRKLERSELIREFIRIEESDTGTVIFVRLINWDVQNPVVNWEKAKIIEKSKSRISVDRAVESLLNNKKYFRWCDECGELLPAGWMFDGKICQGCAQRKHGVVF